MTARRVSVAVLVALLTGQGSPRLAGQPVVRERPQVQNRLPLPEAVRASPSGPMLLETSAPILNLLNRAEEGIARQDWKLAIDSLQRVIEDPEGALVQRADVDLVSTTLFESAKRQAVRRLATLPPEGLEAYRVLFDGKAKGLLERARIHHDVGLLREIVERYLLTNFGDDACDLLASWTLDEGQSGQALALLLDLRELVPDSDVPEELVVSKLAAAYALLGQGDQAKRTLASLASDGAPASPSLAWHTRLERLRPPTFPGVTPNRGVSDLDETIGAVSYQKMPSIDPATQIEPWKHPLSGATSQWWEWINEDSPTAPIRLPPGRLASDGRAIFVRKPGGCAALDPDDLTVLWDSSAANTGPVARRMRSYGSRKAPGAPNAHGSFDDEIGDALSVALGMVFVIERGGAANRATAANVRVVQGQQQSTQNRLSGTRLIAFDAQTGEVRWQHSGFGEPANPLNGAQFRYPPIGVGQELWLAYFKQSDLFFAILNPSDGSLIKTVLLGSARETVDPFGPAAPPLYADGVVFLPSGFGTLFAVDAHDHTVRWARQYDRKSRAGSTTPRDSKGWFPGEPLVRGGLILLAAADQPDLVAFSAVSGDSRWAVPVEAGDYLIAADAERVWVGGRSIACFALKSGEELWNTHLITVPSGRAALCGERVFVPTAAGLLSLSASDGQSLGLDVLLNSPTPLGHLTCTTTALYSLDPTSIRKFPDLDRTYAYAAARYQADPENTEATLRLAWAELLRKQPQQAWDLLATLPADVSERKGGGSSNLTRIKVEAALGLARTSPSGSPDALAWLERAKAAAESVADRLRCGLALADHHVAAGKPDEAYRILWTLGIGDEALATVRVSDTVDAVARIDIARRLREVDALLTPQAKAKLTAETVSIVTDLTLELRKSERTQSAFIQLKSLAQLDAAGPVGHRAVLTAAQWERGRNAFERAEILLREAAGRSTDPLLTAAASVERCALYGRSAQDWPRVLDPCLRELEARFGAVSLDDAEGVTSPVPRGQRVSDWIAQVRSDPVAAVPPMNDKIAAADAGPSIVLTSESAWSRQGAELTPAVPAGRLVDFDPSSRLVLGDRVVTFRQDGMLECLDSTRGETLWQTELRMPGVFPDAMATGGAQNSIEPPRRAVLDGQVAVFNHRDGLYAVGMMTGRRLWVRPFEVVDLPGAAHLRDEAMAVADGVLAAVPQDGRLTLLRLLDGSTVWERDLRGESINRIWMESDRVITSNGSFERVHLFDRADGRLVNQVLFRQADAAAPTVRLVRTEGLIIGPDISGLGSSVVAVSIRTGETVWRADQDLPLLQLFKPQEGFVGLGLGQGMVRVLDAATGETVLEREVPGGRNVTGAILFDGTFIVRTDGARQQKQTVELIAYDVATGENLWQRQDVGSIVSNIEPIPLESGVIPVITETVQTNVSPSGAATPSLRPSLAVIDARTGQNAGVTIDLSSLTSGTRFSGDVMIRPGAIVVGSNRGSVAFRTQPAQPMNQGGNF